MITCALRLQGFVHHPTVSKSKQAGGQEFLEIGGYVDAGRACRRRSMCWSVIVLLRGLGKNTGKLTLVLILS